MLPKYRDILKHEADLDILIFSGDVDGIVPVIGTRRWVASLQLPVVKEWRPWYSHTGELCTSADPAVYKPPLGTQRLFGVKVIVRFSHSV